MFSVGVKFPIDYLHTWDILVEQLMQRVLQDLPKLLLVGRTEVHHFLIWTCVLGCLATVKTCNRMFKACSIERIYFLETRLTTSARSPMTDTVHSGPKQSSKERHVEQIEPPLIRDWKRAKGESLVPFIWHDGACDEGTQQIWKEVQERFLIEG